MYVAIVGASPGWALLGDAGYHKDLITAQGMTPSTEMAELVAALQPNAAETRRFLGLMAGTVAVPDFFAPASVARITGHPIAA